MRGADDEMHHEDGGVGVVEAERTPARGSVRCQTQDGATS